MERRCGAGSGGAEVKEGMVALAEGLDFRALEIDLAVEGHEELNGFDLGIVGADEAAVVDELVGKVFDGVAEDFEGVAGGGVDLAAPGGAGSGFRKRRSGSRGGDTEAGGCRRCHCRYAQVVLRPRRTLYQMTEVPFWCDWWNYGDIFLCAL